MTLKVFVLVRETTIQQKLAALLAMPNYTDVTHPYHTKRLMPSFSTGTLKFISKPVLIPVNLK